MTLSQLAKLANVSISTASKAFSGSREVNEQTRDEIFAVARVNGCFKKFFNAKYPKFVVALICPEVHSRYYAEICFAIQRQLQARNCETCLSIGNFFEQTVVERIEYYEKYSSVDAIVLIDSPIKSTISHELPIVSFGKRCDAANFSIVPNCDEAIGEAIRHCLQCGANTFGFIGERLTETKQTAFENKLAELTGQTYNNGCRLYISEKRFQEGGIEAARAMLEAGTLPDVLMCAYDDMAFGAIRCLADAEIAVPRDLFVIGMDNIPNAEYFCPRLSSVGYDIEYVAEATANGVLSLLSGTACNGYCETIGKFYCRESSILPS